MSRNPFLDDDVEIDYGLKTEDVVIKVESAEAFSCSESESEPKQFRDYNNCFV